MSEEVIGDAKSEPNGCADQMFKVIEFCLAISILTSEMLHLT